MHGSVYLSNSAPPVLSLCPAWTQEVYYKFTSVNDGIGPGLCIINPLLWRSDLTFIISESHPWSWSPTLAGWCFMGLLYLFCSSLGGLGFGIWLGCNHILLMKKHWLALFIIVATQEARPEDADDCLLDSCIVSRSRYFTTYFPHCLNILVWIFMVPGGLWIAKQKQRGSNLIASTAEGSAVCVERVIFI